VNNLWDPPNMIAGICVALIVAGAIIQHGIKFWWNE
jgi:hypothetical protein